MIGPRDMGAGTPAPSAHADTAHRHAHAHDHAHTPRTPAQQLIDQYERLSTPPPPQQQQQRAKSTRRQQFVSEPARPVNDALRLAEMARRRAEKAPAGLRKERSPLRQSLRNLLSVIRKGAEGIGKRRADERLGAVEEAEDAARGGASDVLPPFPSARAQEVAPEGAGANLAPPRRKMTGPLLYLTRGAQLLSADIPGPLIWTHCSATIDINKLVVSSFEGDVAATVHEIHLARCTDIRSLSPAQLTQEEASVLERMPEGESLRVFELMFKDQRKEKFAARSVRERAGWISAIWDAILPDQQEHPPKVPTKPEANNSNHKEKATLPIESPRPKHPQQLSPLLIPSRSQRSLPPLPPPTPASLLPPPPNTSGKHNVANLHLDLSDLQGPISPSIYPPTSQVPSPAASSALSAASTPASAKPRNWHLNAPPSAASRVGSYFVASPTSISGASASSFPSSPSVAHISQLSVVRQRLAQIERNHSRVSGQSPADTPRATPLPSPASSSGWSRREAVFHNAGPRFSNPASPAEDRPVIVPEALATSLRGALQEPAPLKIGPSKEDIRKLSKDVGDIRGALGGASGQPTVHEMVQALEHHARGEKKALRSIQDTLTTLGERVATVASAAEAGTTKKIEQSALVENNEKVLALLTEVKDRLASDFPALANKLEDLKRPQGNDAVTLQNISSSSNGQSPAVTDLLPVLEKLEEMQTLFKTRQTEKNDDNQLANADKILDLMQDDSNKHALLAQQQSDSVRYLNELNMWLEAFVNNGTSQIQGISSNLDRLCRELGFHEIASGPNQARPNAQSNLVNDIRQLVAGMKARDQNFTALQAAVHSLLEVLTASQTQKGADSQAIAGLMDRQRRHQEVLFRAFTNEISGEIKGERLRFVEAMKEATAINVQLHVDQFKQELGREVMAMAEEVGRLQREKQHVETQISDLFSFYSKHKQGNMPLQTIQENLPLATPVRQDRERVRAGIPRSYPRVLPHARQ